MKGIKAACYAPMRAWRRASRAQSAYFAALFSAELTRFFSEASTCPVHSGCPAASGARQVNGTRGAAPLQPTISRIWRSGDEVRWRDRIGVFRRDVGDSEHAEIVIADRTYRVRAPGRSASIRMVGKSTCGRGATGNNSNATAPT